VSVVILCTESIVYLEMALKIIKKRQFDNKSRAGISRLLKEKGREQFWPKTANLHRTRKNLKN
jgi:hypothetical protein